MNVSGLSLRDLEYAVAVAEENHFGRAAERCNVSQPTLSVQVRKLEEALGLVLFERGNRRVMLTPAGQSIVRQARTVLAEAQRLLVLASEGRRRAPYRTPGPGRHPNPGAVSCFPLCCEHCGRSFPSCPWR